MKKILLLIFGVLVALPSLLVAQIGPNTQDKITSTAEQAATNANVIQNERKFAIVEIFDNDQYYDSFKIKKLITEVIYLHEGMVTKMKTPPDTARLFIAEDGTTEFIGTTTWHENVKFDTTWTEISRIDDAATNTTNWGVMTNIAKAAGSTKPGVYNKSFTYVTVTSSPSSIETKPIVCDRLEFFGERWNGHGNVKVFVDDPSDPTKWIQVVTLSQGNQPWVTDFSRMQPSFYYIFPKKEYNSPATAHRMKWETDPGNQYIIDFVRPMKMTLTPRVHAAPAPKK